MTVRELREKYLRFFESKGHTQFPSGSLVPYDVTGRLDESLLFNGAGMIQFKPYFRGVAQPANKKLATAQKCVRTGDIEEVGDLSHLTFFEMMGNFSFGDYFKAQAIAYSWEFLTSSEWLGLDPKKLAFTVYESDDEAYDEWSVWLRGAGIDPETRIFRLDEETNYWPAGAFTNGPPGPCGPNSEMFYWVADGEPPSGKYNREDFLRDDEAKNWLEIWNDVFIQYEWQGHLRNPARPSDGYDKDGMPELPFKSIDTGMGLERTATALAGQKSVYDTDVFRPIVDKVSSLANRSYTSYGSDTSDPTDLAKDRATRIIADHIRTAVFCIADGVLPGNTGRGYVLRRLIRRAVLKGQRTLGIEKPFFHEVFEGVLTSMGDFYTELGERRDVIEKTLENEEKQFLKTLANGIAILEYELNQLLINASPKFFSLIRADKSFDLPLSSELRIVMEAEAALEGSPQEESFFHDTFSGIDAPKANRILKEIKRVTALFPKNQRIEINLEFTGSDAFNLYDTYGFPLEVTQELAEEAGVTVDVEGYEKALQEAQERSRGGQERAAVYAGVEGGLVGVPPTRFLGYDSLESDATVLAVETPSLQRGEGARGEASQILVALDQTPFYASSGGQIGDEGWLSVPSMVSAAETPNQEEVPSRETGEGVGGGETARYKVLEVTKRDNVFLHLVEPLSPGAPHLEPGIAVHAKVDEKRRAMIRRNHTATHLLHAALRKVLGTHVAQAGSYVGPDRLRFDFTHGTAMTEDEKSQVEQIVNEEILKNTPVRTYVDIPVAEAKAKGAMALFGEKYGDKVRMVEIDSYSRELCGGTHVRTTGEIGLFKIVAELSSQSGVRRIEALTGEESYRWVLEQNRLLHETAALLKSNPENLPQAAQKTLEQLREERQKRQKAETALTSAGPNTEHQTPTTEIKGVFLQAKNYGDVDPKIAANALDNAVASNPDLVALAAVASNGKVQFSCKAGPDAIKKGAHAGNLIREVAKIAGGGGGGRPDFATAGGKDPSKTDEALAAARSVLESMLA